MILENLETFHRFHYSIRGSQLGARPAAAQSCALAHLELGLVVVAVVLWVVED